MHTDINKYIYIYILWTGDESSDDLHLTALMSYIGAFQAVQNTLSLQKYILYPGKPGVP